MKTPLLLLTFVLLSLGLHAQHFDAGISFGNASYVGDLLTPRNGSAFKQFNPSISFFTRYNMKKFNIRAGVLFTELKGDDRNGLYPNRGFSFRTPITEVSLVAEWNIAVLDFDFGKAYWMPYVFGGISTYSFNPRRFFDGAWMDLQPLGTEGQGLEGGPEPYKLQQIAIPFGAGINLKFSPKTALRFEIGFRKLFTDYLDDVSGSEVNYWELLREQGSLVSSLSVPGTLDLVDDSVETYTRGLEGLDMYFVYEIGFTYSFGKDDKQIFRYR